MVETVEKEKEVIIIIHLERSEKKNEENKKSIKKVQFFMRFPHSVSFLTFDSSPFLAGWCDNSWCYFIVVQADCVEEF